MSDRYKATDLRFELDEQTGIARLFIDRPAKLNAITMEMREGIVRLFHEASHDDRVRVIIVRGAGDQAFSAGGDIPQFLDVPVPRLADLAYSMSSPERCPKPVIAVIDGHCYGGGLEFALACDFRFATPRSRFAFPEITLGALPGSGGTQRAVRLMGMTRAKAMVLTGRPISAERAEHWGLISYLVEPAALDQEVDSLAAHLARLSPVALSFAKAVLSHAPDASLAAGFHMEGKAMTVLTQMEDFEEGVAAWKEKRPGVFKGV